MDIEADTHFRNKGKVRSRKVSAYYFLELKSKFCRFN